MQQEVWPRVFIWVPRWKRQYKDLSLSYRQWQNIYSLLHFALAWFDPALQNAVGIHDYPLHNAPKRFDSSECSALETFDSPLHNAVGSQIFTLQNAAARHNSPLTKCSRKIWILILQWKDFGTQWGDFCKILYTYLIPHCIYPYGRRDLTPGCKIQLQDMTPLVERSFSKITKSPRNRNQKRSKFICLTGGQVGLFCAWHQGW